MIRPLQDIPFFLNELAYFAQLLRGKTGIEQNPNGSTSEIFASPS